MVEGRCLYPLEFETDSLPRLGQVPLHLFSHPQPSKKHCPLRPGSVSICPMKSIDPMTVSDPCIDPMIPFSALMTDEVTEHLLNVIDDFHV